MAVVQAVALALAVVQAVALALALAVVQAVALTLVRRRSRTRIGRLCGW